MNAYKTCKTLFFNLKEFKQMKTRNKYKFLNPVLQWSCAFVPKYIKICPTPGYNN